MVQTDLTAVQSLIIIMDLAIAASQNNADERPRMVVQCSIVITAMHVVEEHPEGRHTEQNVSGQHRCAITDDSHFE